MAGQIVQRGKKTYLVRVFLGRDSDGKRRYHNKTIHGNKKEAQAYLNKVLREKDIGDFVEPSTVSTEEFLRRWLETAVQPRVRQKTYDSYRWLVEKYILPALGMRKLSAITPLEVQKFYNALQEEKGLSPRTIRLTHSVLRNALDQAIKWRILQHNPCEHADLPRKSSEEMRCLSPAEARQFMEAAQGTRYGVLFETLLVTGMRPSEALGLKWGDIDWDRQRLHVQRALENSSDGWNLQEPKTRRARRTIPFPSSLATALRQQRKEQAEGQLQAGQDWQEHGLVFTDSNGNPVNYRNLTRRYFKPLLMEADLPNIRLYDLRHTAATLLLSAGENPKVVSERLGHASVSLTLDTYSHVLPDMQERAASRLQQMLYE